MDANFVESILNDMERATDPKEVTRLEKSLDKALAQIKSAKTRVVKRAREKRKEIAEQRTELEQAISALALTSALSIYKQRHIERDMNILISQSPNRQDAKLFATREKRRLTKYIRDRYADIDRNPAICTISLENYSNFNLVYDVLAPFIENYLSFRPIIHAKKNVAVVKKRKVAPKKKRKVAPKKKSPATKKDTAANTNVAALRAAANTRPAPSGAGADTAIDLVGNVGTEYTCAICTDTYLNGKEPTLKCGNRHEFCLSCIKTWLGSTDQKSCPTCRIPMKL